ncbi:Putative uncharacterized protein [Mycobacterium tuberculosis variant bovis]|uniref:Uncharacterized protein n=1 Tax=Mycobacterium tuberculosis (strain CDC 1551 / Oshkosh) TaxID=83331 RepID=Q8VJX9_MYCTO|nr:hypothetical protein MT1775 [Mycobacterium tuberculosis CDC1551]CEJ28822.1 Putative uncharacterized protein [Mycobacterium tuberculosis variant bovis]CEJ37401.1 Putative uncharacterized protein [Mycobacterium tuberculosis variant bovis]CEJ37996.1 Putative uncharacterized protein [Mycobacterium tuberculosis variant bovis]CEJ52344.1 Putative uncharacterized protein [Mycobacterium tuberculosis variant caprae]
MICPKCWAIERVCTPGLTYRPKTGLPPSGRSSSCYCGAPRQLVDRQEEQRAAMVIAAAVVSGQRSQHGRHDVDRAVDGANSLCRLAETDQRDLRWVDHPEDRVNPLVTDVGHGDREVR